MATRIAIIAAALLLAGWTEPHPPPVGSTPPPQYQTRVLPPLTQPHRPQLPMGPVGGSIERYLQIQQRGGLSC